MVTVFANMSMSQDGFVAGPNDSVEQPLGDGGAGPHDWMLHGESEFSGEVNHGHEGFFNLSENNHNVVAEWLGSTGALAVGHRILEYDEP